MKKKSVPSVKRSLVVLRGKSANAKALSALVAAASPFTGCQGEKRTLIMNRRFVSGVSEEIALTISPRNTARGTSMRFVLTVTRLRPKGGPRRLALMLER